MAHTAHGAGIAFGKADDLAAPGGHHQFILAGGQAAPCQAVALVQGNGVQAAAANVGILLHSRALDQALYGDLGHIALGFILLGLLVADHVGDLFALLQLQQIDDVGALAGAAALDDLVALQLEHTAAVGHKQHTVMAGAHKQLLHKVLILMAQAADAAAAAVLHLIGIGGGALDIALVGEGIHAFFLGDQILNVHLAAHMLNTGAALIAVFITQDREFVFHNSQHLGIVGQKVFPVFDLSIQLVQFVFNLKDLQTGQFAQLHFHNGIGLHFVKLEGIHHSLACLGHAALAGADGGNDLVHNIHSPVQAIQNMGALLGLLQIKGRAAAHDLILELHILLDHLFQVERFGGVVVQRDHDHAHGVLQLGEAVQLVQDHRGIGALAQIHHDLHALAAGKILDIANALYALFFDKIGHFGDQAGLVDHIGDLGDHDLLRAVFIFHDLGTAAQGDFAAARGVGSANAAVAHDHAAGGEVGALDMLHQAGQLDLGVVNIGNAAVDHFGQVVGGNVGGHAHGNALTAVYQQVGESAGKNAGLLFGFIKVGCPVDGFLVDIGEHFLGDLAHAGLGVTISSRRVAVYRTKVTLAFHQRIAQAEILCQTHHGIVHAGVTMGVIAAQHSANGVGTFAGGMMAVVASLVHGIQNAAMHRL